MESSGLEHCPSGDFNANGTRAVLASIAHNLVRWRVALGLEATGLLVAKTIRRKFFPLPGRITSHWRTLQLHLPPTITSPRNTIWRREVAVARP